VTKQNKLLKIISIVLGLVSTAFFIFDYFVFASLRPKMIRFEAISPPEEGLLNWVGIGLLLFLAFCLLSLFQIAKYLKNAKKITLFSLFLLASGVLSLLFIFSDVALLNDIGKQYRYGLAQPEWLLLYFVMGFQFITGIMFTYLHISGFTKEKQLEYVAKDSNIFFVVQYVGVICGLLGLLSSSLGFLFANAWNLVTHTTIGSIVLLTPYSLAVLYWLLIKLQEKPRQWYDEKQLQDIGKSSFSTLILSVIFMNGLFVANYRNLGGVVSILWLPLYLFLVLLLFSSGNLYFSGKN
jgi:hypothetical protein